MPIPESDIAILIPTYRYRDKVGRAVASALASGAGEIIVTDDRGGDGTIELLEGYDDPRLHVYENPQNLGLWENHLQALGYATKPWIKFIQADDYLLPGGLASYAAVVEPDDTVVWASAVVKNDQTGEVMQFNDLKEPCRLDGETLLETCIYVGWVLGSPSHMMVRADMIERDPAAWVSDISADVVLGAVAAVQGSVALLPPGAIGQGAHPCQDAKTQGSCRGLRRQVNTTAYLQRRPEPALRRFASLWAAMNRTIALRTAVSGMLRGEIHPLEAVRLVRRNFELSRAAGPERMLLRAACNYRRSAQVPHDLTRVIDQLVLCHPE